MSQEHSRRNFSTNSAAAALTMSARSLRAQDLPRTGVIGVGVRGSQMLKIILQTDMTAVAAVCDNHEGRLAAGVEASARDKPKSYSEYRRLLDDKSLDAIYIATPCHLKTTMVLEGICGSVAAKNRLWPKHENEGTAEGAGSESACDRATASRAEGDKP